MLHLKPNIHTTRRTTSAKKIYKFVDATWLIRRLIKNIFYSKLLFFNKRWNELGLFRNKTVFETEKWR